MAETRKHNSGPTARPTKSTIKVLNRTMPLPASRTGRIALGSALVTGGALGFLPVLGFWMLPLGFLVLAHDVPRVRRWRRRLVLRFSRRKENRRRGGDAA